jgi:hypothetical protein
VDLWKEKKKVVPLPWPGLYLAHITLPVCLVWRKKKVVGVSCPPKIKHITSSKNKANRARMKEIVEETRLPTTQQ